MEGELCCDVCANLPVSLIRPCRLLLGQDEWDSSWTNTAGGGKVPSSRQTKGQYRDHPYGRY